MIRLFVVDSHPLFIRGIREALRSNRRITLVGTAKSGRDAQRSIARLQPQVVLVDLLLPDITGVALSLWMKESLPSTRILWTSNNVSESYIELGRSLQVKGFVAKTNDAITYLRAIVNIADGEESWVMAGPQPSSSERSNEPVLRDGVLSLTERQKQIAQLVAAGLANKEIAERLKIAKRTVDTHRMYIYRKLNVHSAAQLTRFCLQHASLS